MVKVQLIEQGQLWLSARLSLFRFLMSAPAPQQINVADLELPQLGEVKRQLEEVGIVEIVISTTLH